MVNPKKHDKNLNEKDLTLIYERLNQQYDRARDYSTKKDINQQIIILILLCRRFPVADLVKIDYEYFDSEPKDSILYKHLQEQIKNNYCDIDGLLLTNRHKSNFKVEDIDKILSLIDTGNINKEITANTLNITNSKFNDYGKVTFNKKKIRKYISLKQQLEDMKEIIDDNTTSDVDLTNLNEKIDMLSTELKDHINKTNPINEITTLSKNINEIEEKQTHLEDNFTNQLKKLTEKINNIPNNEFLHKELKDYITKTTNNKEINDLINKITEIEEKQQISEDKLTNKYNIINNTITEIHQNTIASNKKYSELTEKINNLENTEVEKNLQDIIKELDENYHNIEEKIEIIIQLLNNTIISEKQHEHTSSNIQSTEDNKTRLISTDNGNKQIMNTLYVPKEKNIKKEDFKEFMIEWFNTNIIITKSMEDTLTLDNIINKIEKFLESRNITLDKKLLFDRIESYLKTWFNQNSDLNFSTIKTTSISGNIFYTNLKYMDIKQVRENKIKNSIIAWLKIHTKEEKGGRTYNKELYDLLKPLFEKNGWIITKKDEWKELQEAGLNKICESRSFSQIIGKSLKEIYSSVNEDTIQRDTPNPDKKVTWYPNITIINKEISDELDSKISDELSDKIFNSDNLILNWLTENLIFTNNESNKTYQSSILKKLEEYIQHQKINIKPKTLEKIFVNSLNRYLDSYNIIFNPEENEIKYFVILSEYYESTSNIIDNWISNHLIITDNNTDKTYIEDIDEKLINLLNQNNIYVVDEEVYKEVSDKIKNKFIPRTQFNHQKNRILEKELKIEQHETASGAYFPSLKIIKYITLTPNHITEWVKKNMPELLKSHAELKIDIFNKFNAYLLENNIKNQTNHSSEKLLETAIIEYYKNQDNIMLITNAEIDGEELFILKTK